MSNLKTDNKVVKLYTTAEDRVNAYIEHMIDYKDNIEDVITIIVLKNRNGYLTVSTSMVPEDFAVAASLCQKEFSDAMDLDEDENF